VLLLVSVNGQQSLARTGLLTTAGSYGQMSLHSYKGDPGAGAAWTFNVPVRASVSPVADVIAYALATAAQYRRR
jgi:hypothetical protein